MARLPALAKIAVGAVFSQATVTRYGKTETIAVHAFTCLLYSVTDTAPVTVILIGDKPKTGYDLALVTTETSLGTAQVIKRYAARWAIKATIEDSRQLFGAGQARNHTAATVERTDPFMLACQALAVCWYATAGHHPADLEVHRVIFAAEFKRSTGRRVSYKRQTFIRIDLHLARGLGTIPHSLTPTRMAARAMSPSLPGPAAMRRRVRQRPWPGQTRIRSGSTASAAGRLRVH